MGYHIRSLLFGGLELVEKPSVFRQLSGFTRSSLRSKQRKPQGVGCAGKARLTHE